MVKKKSFFKIKYTGTIKEAGEKFDSAEEKVIPLTSGYLLEGLEKKLLNKSVGESFKITLKPEEAFGERDSNKVKVISKRKFKDRERPLRKGARLSINGKLATVKTITGGRVMVDFNHPLAGKEVKYKGEILEKVENNEEKVKAVIDKFRLEPEDIKVGESKAIIKTDRDLPDWIKENIKEDIEEYIGLKPKFKKIKKEEEKKEETEDKKKV